MSKTVRGKRDGTGPYKDSDQRRTSKVGKRIERGEKCPAIVRMIDDDRQGKS